MGMLIAKGEEGEEGVPRGISKFVDKDEGKYIAT